MKSINKPLEKLRSIFLISFVVSVFAVNSIANTSYQNQVPPEITKATLSLVDHNLKEFSEINERMRMHLLYFAENYLNYLAAYESDKPRVNQLALFSLSEIKCFSSLYPSIGASIFSKVTLWIVNEDIARIEREFIVDSMVSPKTFELADKSFSKFCSQ